MGKESVEGKTYNVTFSIKQLIMYADMGLVKINIFEEYVNAKGEIT